jgi:hypothetical protein
MTLSFAIILLAACFKAIADTLAHHFDTSMFKKWNTPFWNPLHAKNDSVKKIFRYPLDAWHIANSGMICAFLALFVYAIFYSIELPAIQLFTIQPWHVFIVAGIWYNFIFWLCYDKLLRDLD